jgi:hypothetical protein
MSVKHIVIRIPSAQLFWTHIPQAQHPPGCSLLGDHSPTRPSKGGTQRPATHRVVMYTESLTRARITLTCALVLAGG